MANIKILTRQLNSDGSSKRTFNRIEGTYEFVDCASKLDSLHKELLANGWKSISHHGAEELYFWAPTNLLNIEGILEYRFYISKDRKHIRALVAQYAR